MNSKKSKDSLKKVGVYIHFPFCKHRCFYCHFVKRQYDHSLVERYLCALEREIGLYKNRCFLVDTIYIGGGSPSLLSETQLFRILEKVNKSFYIHGRPEVTIEMNPEDVTKSKLGFIKKLGINRLSIGAQSFNQEDLFHLQRSHTVQQNFSAIKNVLQAGFTNLNIDYIIGLPGQSEEVLYNNFKILKNHNIPHVSVYILEGEKKNDSEEKDTEDNSLYYFSKKFLTQFEYKHYEVSNYCKRGFEARHNLKYWKNQSYIGVGVSASGFLDGIDYKNTGDLENYFKMVKTHQLPREEINKSNSNQRKIIMGLRLLEGVPISFFRSFPDQLEFYLDNQLFIRKKNRIAIHPQKILLLNEVLMDFV